MLNIKQRQTNLWFLGYYNMAIDGIVGNGTIQAYKNFQRDYGLVVDGIYGPKTEAKLIEVIKKTQRELGVTADGLVGPITINARNKKNLSWKDIKHFQKFEFNCPCGCGKNNVDLNLVKILDEIREYYDRPLIIVCGCRCQRYNDIMVGSIKNSKHVQDKAADFWIPGIATAVLLAKCQEYIRSGRASYAYTNETNMKNLVHLDVP